MQRFSRESVRAAFGEFYCHDFTSLSERTVNQTIKLDRAKLQPNPWWLKLMSSQTGNDYWYGCSRKKHDPLADQSDVLCHCFTLDRNPHIIYGPGLSFDHGFREIRCAFNFLFAFFYSAFHVVFVFLHMLQRTRVIKFQSPTPQPQFLRRSHCLRPKVIPKVRRSIMRKCPKVLVIFRVLEKSG